MTVKQEKPLLLLKTGLRISEFVGLTKADIDLEKGIISVNHQLQRKRNMEYIIEETKKESGTRLVEDIQKEMKVVCNQ